MKRLGRKVAMRTTKRQEPHEGTVVQVGNSRARRLPAGLVHAHTENIVPADANPLRRVDQLVEGVIAD